MITITTDQFINYLIIYWIFSIIINVLFGYLGRLSIRKFLSKPKNLDMNIFASAIREVVKKQFKKPWTKISALLEFISISGFLLPIISIIATNTFIRMLLKRKKKKLEKEKQVLPPISDENFWDELESNPVGTQHQYEDGHAIPDFLKEPDEDLILNEGTSTFKDAKIILKIHNGYIIDSKINFLNASELFDPCIPYSLPEGVSVKLFMDDEEQEDYKEWINLMTLTPEYLVIKDIEIRHEDAPHTQKIAPGIQDFPLTKDNVFHETGFVNKFPDHAIKFERDLCFTTLLGPGRNLHIQFTLTDKE